MGHSASSTSNAERWSWSRQLHRPSRCCLGTIRSLISPPKYFFVQHFPSVLGRSVHISVLGMSSWSVLRSTATKHTPQLSRYPTRSIDAFCNRLVYPTRSYSVCQRHAAHIRARKSSIRGHIRLLEQSRRRFTASPSQRHAHIDPPKPGEELHIGIIDKEGDRHDFEVAKGDNILDIAQANDLEMEGKFHELKTSTWC